MCAAWSGGGQVGGGGNPQPGLTKVPQAGPAFLLSTPQLLQRRRRPPAPGRAPGRRGLISSYQVRPVTCDSGWGRADCSGTQEQASKSRERLYPCGRGSWARGLAGLRSPPPHLLFPQTQILREVALDLGSRGGVQGSLSSTQASRGASPPPIPPVPRVQHGPCPPLHTPQHHPLFSPSKKPASGVDFDDP